MPAWLEVIILGIIEGVTEFLPISSTGHLLIARQWLDHPQSDTFVIVIQSGAVLAVLLAFQQRVKELARDFREPGARDYLLKLGLAFGITGVGGLLLKKAGFELPESPLPVALALLVGGLLFFWVEKRPAAGRPGTDRVSWAMAGTAGVAQLVAAVFPGTSRSGAAILFLLVMGLSRRMAVEFSFLLGVPTLLAAGGYEALSAWREGALELDWGLLLLGTVISAITAFASVRWLLRYLERHTFVIFGWYRTILGLVLLVLFLA